VIDWLASCWLMVLWRRVAACPTLEDFQEREAIDSFSIKLLLLMDLLMTGLVVYLELLGTQIFR